MTKLLVGAFEEVLRTCPTDLLPFVYLLTGGIAPQHEGLKLGIGNATLIKVGLASSRVLY